LKAIKHTKKEEKALQFTAKQATRKREIELAGRQLLGNERILINNFRSGPKRRV